LQISDGRTGRYSKGQLVAKEGTGGRGMSNSYDVDKKNKQKQIEPTAVHYSLRRTEQRKLEEKNIRLMNRRKEQ